MKQGKNWQYSISSQHPGDPRRVLTACQRTFRYRRTATPLLSSHQRDLGSPGAPGKDPGTHGRRGSPHTPHRASGRAIPHLPAQPQRYPQPSPTRPPSTATEGAALGGRRWRRQPSPAPPYLRRQCSHTPPSSSLLTTYAKGSARYSSSPGRSRCRARSPLPFPGLRNRSSSAAASMPPPHTKWAAPPATSRRPRRHLSAYNCRHAGGTRVEAPARDGAPRRDWRRGSSRDSPRGAKRSD